MVGKTGKRKIPKGSKIHNVQANKKRRPQKNDFRPFIHKLIKNEDSAEISKLSEESMRTLNDVLLHHHREMVKGLNDYNNAKKRQIDVRQVKTVAYERLPVEVFKYAVNYGGEKIQKYNKNK
jgi:chlorite dismutase